MTDNNEMVIYSSFEEYQLCVCMDQTLTFSLQDRLPMGTPLGTSLQRVALGNEGAA
jgi:hypothetical protein